MLSWVSGSVGELGYASWQLYVYTIVINNLNVNMLWKSYRAHMATGGAAGSSGVGRTTKGENDANTRNC